MSLENDWANLPLAAVRAFEAAARLHSFTAAAGELGLTQSAISRHVRTLEDRFSVRLFDRRGRGVVLTVAGDAYFRPVSEGLRLIRLASREMRSHRLGNRLTISLLPSVAALWLAPRLADFAARHPTIELFVQASRTLVDFSVDAVDLSIRYGLGNWPSVKAEALAGETLTPVCSPDFARLHRLGSDASALLSLPLLADDLVDGWERWFAAAGVAPPPSVSGPRLDDSASLYHAAASGLGVALGRSLLVERALAEGTLVAPFGQSVPATYSYWIVRPDRGEPTPAARQFLGWLRDQRPHPASRADDEPPFGTDSTTPGR